MKVQNSSYENNNSMAIMRAKSNNPSFKGGLDIAGSTMQWIQDKGFLASFLIQDGLGMTTPRVATGFLRDKEVTGKFNTQEGFEVLGREGLTGPIMMAMAPLMLLIAGKFGKSTSVNSQLIKRFGNSLKELLTNKNFDKELLKKKDAFQKTFFKDNIRKILNETIGESNVKDEHISTLMEHVDKYINIPESSDKMFKRGKYKKAQMNEIIEYINNLKSSTSSDFEMLEKVKFGNKAYSTKDAFEAMIKYSDDVLALDSNLEKLDEAAAEKLKNKTIGKRVLTNIGTVAATLGVMSILPKIYAKSDIAPGARTAMELKEKELEAKEENQENINFKAAKPKKSFLERIGQFTSEKIKDSLASELEYNGHNFTNTLMAGLSVFGLLFPRGARAVSRAQVDDTGKKDMTELYEILIRDLTSSLAVIFAVPLLTRALVSSYENKSGFVLLDKDRSRTGWKAVKDLLNPYSSSRVLSNKELKSIYSGADTKEKMLNFCEYIDKNGGDLRKILSKSDFANEVFNSKTQTLDSLANLSKKEGNAKIKEVISNLGENADQLIKKLMQDGQMNKKGTKMKVNKIFSSARGLNSVPALIMTVLVSPVLLGWLIPRLTYANTRRIHAKRAQEAEQNKINTAA